MLLAKFMSEKPGSNVLMHEVCAGKGWFGGPQHVTEFIPKSGVVTAAQFVDWLFKAEGADTDLEKWQKHKEGLPEVFVRHMSGDAVDASSLQWDHS